MVFPKGTKLSPWEKEKDFRRAEVMALQTVAPTGLVMVLQNPMDVSKKFPTVQMKTTAHRTDYWMVLLILTELVLVSKKDCW
jgi:hypothetical protein